jgi:recombination protein RecT
MSQMLEIHNELARMEDEFAAALPPQIPAKRFLRTLMTAIQMNPKLLNCDRKSLLGAAMKAAQDGLLPDGRYGVIVPYSTKVDGKYQLLAQWQPMILGVYQKLHNSGDIKDIIAHLVYENDIFNASQGDNESYEHLPDIFGDRGKEIGVYAIAHTTNGGTYRDAMSKAEIEKIRNMSRAADSMPWREFWGEMAKKTIVKRLAKSLPLSIDDMSWLQDEDEQVGDPVSFGMTPDMPRKIYTAPKYFNRAADEVPAVPKPWVAELPEDGEIEGGPELPPEAA